MKILYWGTPAYAVPTLQALHQAGHSIVGVVTQPDRRRGRGKQLVPSPVKTAALELGIPVFTPNGYARSLTARPSWLDWALIVRWWWLLAKFFPKTYWNNRLLAAGTATVPCCLVGEERAQFSGP